MSFGEVVEPSTRALLIDEDDIFVDYPVDYSFLLEWEGTKATPEVINSLIFVESAPLLTLLKNKTFQSYASIKTAGMSVFALENNDFLVVCDMPDSLTHGEVVVNFFPWIEKAQNIYCISSKPQPLHVNRGATENSDTFLRSVTYKNANDFNCKKLEVPNLASGIVASVFSFCVFKEKSCALFIAFVCSAPLDSVTAKPIVELLSDVGVCKEGDLKINVSVPSNNLYM